MIFLLLSFLLLIFSFFLLKKTKYFLVFFSIIIFIHFFLSSGYIVANYFTGNGVDESVIYHLFIGLDGAGFGADLKIIIIGIGILIIGIFLSFFSYFFGKKINSQINIYKNIIFFVLLISSFVFHPILKNFYDLGYFSFSKESSIEFEDKKYIIPEVKALDEKTKNIVYIYLESFESIYLNEDIFPNLTPNLNSLREEASFFTDVDQAYGTSWTIAGMVGSQCGIPLINSGGGGNSMHGISDFLSGAFCIGDFLKNFDYELSYIGGAKLEFAGKGNFYKTHSFDNIFGRDELLEKLNDKTYENDWGFYDDKTFSFVLDEYKRLKNTGKKFGLFTLTLDTHGDTGVISKSCLNNLYNKNNQKSILNAYHCNDFLVGKLVSEIKKLDENNDTIIVISSDHFAMSHNNTSDILKKNQKDRRNLFMIIDGKKDIIDKRATTLDIGPTILHKAGFKIDNLGFGINLFSDLDSKPNSILKKYRSVYESFWSYPSIKSGITFDFENNNVFFKDKSIKFPALISLDENFETKKILWTDIDNPKSIFEVKIPNSILINFCEESAKICLKFFDKDLVEKDISLDKSSEISYEDILKNLE